MIVIFCVLLFVALSFYFFYKRKWSPLEAIVATCCIALGSAEVILIGNVVAERLA